MALGMIQNASNQKTDYTFTLKFFQTFMRKKLIVIEKTQKIELCDFQKRLMSSNFAPGA